MQQRADRRGRHHRRGQPGVQRHHRGLGEPEQVAEVDHAQQRRRGVDPRQQPARHEVERPRQMVGQRQRREQPALRRAHQVDEVFPRAVPGLVVLVVVDERIGDEAQDLVEDHQGEQVGGERTSGRRREAGGETGEEPGLRVLLQAAHVADGIDRRRDPEQRRDAREHHPQRVDPEGEVDPRQDLEQPAFDHSARQHRGRHRGDDPEHDHRRQRRDCVPQPFATVEEKDQRRRQGGDGDGQQRPDRYDRVQAANPS